MDEYIRLSDASAVSSSSDHSMNVSSGVIKVLKDHGYTIEEELGRGASGTVFLVTDADEDLYVVKQRNSRDGEELAEIEILKTLQFGYIVTYVDSFEDKEAGRIYIVMEYCGGGDLSKIMEKQKDERFFGEKQILDWLVQVCLALQFLHEKNILHRDIKPQNIFLTDDGYINLGDFGSSKALERASEYANSLVGAKPYISPEVYQRKYKSKSDIWSLGWVLHDLCMLDVWDGRLIADPSDPETLSDLVISVSSDRLVTSRCVNLIHEIRCDASGFRLESVFRGCNCTHSSSGSTHTHQLVWLLALVMIILLMMFLIAFLLHKRKRRDPEAGVQMKI